VNRAAVGFGGNLGRPDVAFEQALSHLRTHSALTLVEVSGLYRSDPWQGPEQPDYLNGVATFETILSPRRLLDLLHEEERSAGRERRERWGPRTLDLDLLWFGDLVQQEPDLVLPHPRLPERSFVLEPLIDVAPDWRHPETHVSAAEMLDRLRRTGAVTACERIAGVALGDLIELAPCRR
jgi:2-amino-4-hydroxy-6-hydroxymethyldihydropteridine diphosphokinase